MKNRKAAKKAKATRTTRKKTLGGRQKEIPGTEGVRHHDVDEAAVLALDAGRAFTAAGQRRKGAYDALETKMEKHGLTNYLTADRLRVTRIERADRVKVEPAEESV